MAPPSNIDTQTLYLMGEVCEAAWDRLFAAKVYTAAEEKEARVLIAARMVAAVSAGQRDREKLIQIAMRGP
jgi:hypothetical protein